LWITGSFQSTRHSFDFVKAKTFDRIETINKLALRLEYALMMDVVSCDVCLLFERPGSVFSDTRMTKEIDSDEASAPRRQDKVAGTTELGLGKSVCGGQGKDRRTEVLLKSKVVLEGDFGDL
jgi:hypothetical protein